MPSAVGYQPTLANEMGALQERITSTKVRFGHLGAGGLRPGGRPDRPRPGDDLLAPGRYDRCSAVRYAEQGIYPAVDPLGSNSRILEADIVGEEHYRIARRVQETLQKYQ